MSLEIILASKSPRRRRILEEMGLSFEVMATDVDEVHWDDDPIGTVSVNAERKCLCVQKLYPNRLVIAADTVVAFDGKCIGKPKSIEEARDMLRLFSGNTQTVYSGIAIAAPKQTLYLHLEKSEVHFCEISEDIIEKYHTFVDPLDRAGGYDIDCHSELIISGYDGSFTNIMGLPKEIVNKVISVS